MEEEQNNVKVDNIDDHEIDSKSDNLEIELIYIIQYIYDF